MSRPSSAHNLTIAALEKVGLTYGDATPVYLAPADGAAAFARGAIDAWTIWDPLFAIAEEQKTTRVLALSTGITWAKYNQHESAKLFSEATGVDLDAQRRTVERTEFVFSPVSDAVSR